MEGSRFIQVPTLVEGYLLRFQINGHYLEPLQVLIFTTTTPAREATFGVTPALFYGNPTPFWGVPFPITMAPAIPVVLIILTKASLGFMA